MRSVVWWDIIPATESTPHLEQFFKCEEYGRTRHELDHDWMQVVCEWRKRVQLGNDSEDQEWHMRHLREARVRMN